MSDPVRYTTPPPDEAEATRPKAYTVPPPDEAPIQAQPEDRDAQILTAMLGPEKAALAKRSSQYKPGQFTELVKPDTSALGKLNNMTGQIFSGVRDVTLGQANNAQHLLAKVGMVSPEDEAYSDALMKAREFSLGDDLGRPQGGIPRFLGNAAATFSPVSVVGKAGKLGNAIREANGFWATGQAAAGAGGLMGMLGAAVQPDASPMSIGIGGAAGAVLTPALSGAGYLIGKGTGLLRTEMPPAMDELEALGKKWDVKLPAGMIDKSLARTQDALTSVPFSGMGDELATTQSQAQSAAKRLVSQLKEKVLGSGTASEVARDSGIGNQTANRDIGHQIYDAATQLAGKKQAPRFNTIQVMQDELAANAKLNRPDAALETEYLGRIDRLTNKGAQAVPGEVPMDKSFMGLNNLRSEFVGEASKYEKGTPENARYLRLIDAVDRDMDTFVDSQGNPALRGVYDQAKSWWRQRVKNYSPDSFEYSAWAKEMRGKDLNAEKVMDGFIRANEEGKAKYFYAGLDENGRNAVKWGMAQDAYTAATGNGQTPFSPAKFAAEFQKKAEATGVFFRGQDKWEIDGFNKLMRAVSGVTEGQMVRTTGKGAILPAIAGAQGSAALAVPAALYAGNPAAAAGAAVTAFGPTVIGKLGTWLFTSPAGKRLLLSASEAAPGSKAFAAVLRDLEAAGFKMTPEAAGPTVAAAAKKFQSGLAAKIFRPELGSLNPTPGAAGQTNPQNAYRFDTPE